MNIRKQYAEGSLFLSFQCPHCNDGQVMTVKVAQSQANNICQCAKFEYEGPGEGIGIICGSCGKIVKIWYSIAEEECCTSKNLKTC